MKILIAIIVVALVGWGIYALAKKGSDNNSTNSTQSTTDNSNSSDTSQTPSPTPTPTGAVTPLTLSSASDATLGTYLVAANGMTLYKYTKDTAGVSNCSGNCAVQWPPYTVTSTAGLAAATGIGGNIATIARADGTMQLTYNNIPLYFWYKDTKVGDTTGQNVGGVWFVVKP